MLPKALKGKMNVAVILNPTPFVLPGFDLLSCWVLIGGCWAWHGPFFLHYFFLNNLNEQIRLFNNTSKWVRGDDKSGWKMQCGRSSPLSVPFADRWVCCGWLNWCRVAFLLFTVKKKKQKKKNHADYIFYSDVGFSFLFFFFFALEELVCYRLCGTHSCHWPHFLTKREPHTSLLVLFPVCLQCTSSV